MKRSSPLVRKPASTSKLAVAVKAKACRECKGMFTALRPMQVVCGLECSVRFADKVIAKSKAKQAAADRKARRDGLARLKPRSKWLAEAQVAFNAWVRAEDEFRGCISCGTNTGKMNAGHFRSVGSCPELRFERANVHKQCERCNTFFHGNLLGYRAGLKGRISEERLEWLEGPHPPKHYSIDDLKQIISTYRAKTKELKA
jgi:hypothetical protein